MRILFCNIAWMNYYKGQVIQRINGGLILGMDGKRIAMCDAAADRIQV